MINNLFLFRKEHIQPATVYVLYTQYIIDLSRLKLGNHSLGKCLHMLLYLRGLKTYSLHHPQSKGTLLEPKKRVYSEKCKSLTVQKLRSSRVMIAKDTTHFELGFQLDSIATLGRMAMEP